MGETRRRPWPIKAETNESFWVRHPDKAGWEINVLDMTERKVKVPKPKK